MKIQLQVQSANYQFYLASPWLYYSEEWISAHQQVFLLVSPDRQWQIWDCSHCRTRIWVREAYRTNKTIRFWYSISFFHLKGLLVVEVYKEPKMHHRQFALDRCYFYFDFTHNRFKYRSISSLHHLFWVSSFQNA